MLRYKGSKFKFDGLRNHIFNKEIGGEEKTGKDETTFVESPSRGICSQSGRHRQVWKVEPSRFPVHNCRNSVVPFCLVDLGVLRAPSDRSGMWTKVAGAPRHSNCDFGRKLPCWILTDKAPAVTMNCGSTTLSLIGTNQAWRNRMTSPRPENH